MPTPVNRAGVGLSATLLSLVSLLGTSTFAQTAPETAAPVVEMGARVRLQTKATADEAGLTHVGEVVDVSDDEVTVQLDGRLHKVSIPRSAVRQVERSQGKIRVGSRFKSGLKGLAVGAAAGWLVGELVRNSCEDGGPCEGTSGTGKAGAQDKSNEFAAWFGAAGAVSGALLGSHEVEQWEGASFAAPKSNPVAISRRGFRASIRISF